MRIAELIGNYLAWQARHNKPATVRFYRLGLRWLSEGFGEREWSTLDRAELIPALDAANERPDGTAWAPDTIRRNLIAITQLQKWAAELHDLTPILRPKDLKKPPGRRRDRIPSLEELAAIMQAAPPALELALRSLAQSGMRPGELVRSRIEDLNPARDLLLIPEHKTAKKTGQPRRIPLGEKLREFVLQAIGERESGPIWTEETGKAWTVQKLSAAFRRLRKQLGFERSLVLYSLRHWKGSQVARDHGIYAAKTILGHTQISTTQRYAHPDDDSARRWQD